MKVRIVTSIDQRLLHPTSTKLSEMVQREGMTSTLNILAAIQRLPMTHKLDDIDRDINNVLSRLFRVRTPADVNSRRRIIAEANLITFHIGLSTGEESIRCELKLKRGKELLWDCYFFMPPNGALAQNISMGGWRILD
jgi:hypothetical protein